MFSIFKKNKVVGSLPSLLLTIKVNGEVICQITQSEVPCERTPSKFLEEDSTLEFVDSSGEIHRHDLGTASGWFHFSFRLHKNLACQADCVISDSSKFDPQAFPAGKAAGIRFQPFFLAGAQVKNSDLHGKGLFARGLHFNGNVTSGNTIISCECDQCKRSFQIHSYHAGFSNSGYFYSESGKYTTTVSSYLPGSPVALLEPNPEALANLEAALPLAPDGTAYKYLNPFRCPYCSAPYIDFASHPEIRPGEYYGNYFVGAELLRYEPAVA